MGETGDIIVNRLCKGEGRFFLAFVSTSTRPAPTSPSLLNLFLLPPIGLLFSRTIPFPSSPAPVALIPSPTAAPFDLRTAPPNRRVISSTEGGNWTLEPNVG